MPGCPKSSSASQRAPDAEGGRLSLHEKAVRKQRSPATPTPRAPYDRNRHVPTSVVLCSSARMLSARVQIIPVIRVALRSQDALLDHRHIGT